MCNIYFQLLNRIMPVLLDQDYLQSIVVKKAFNSLMGLYCKEKNTGNSKEKNNTSSPTHLLCCLWLEATPGDLTSWVKYHVWLWGNCPEWFINKNFFISAARNDLQVVCQWSALTLVWSIVPQVQQGLLEENTTVVFYGFRNGISQWRLPQPELNYSSQSHFWFHLIRCWLSPDLWGSKQWKVAWGQRASEISPEGGPAATPKEAWGHPKVPEFWQIGLLINLTSFSLQCLLWLKHDWEGCVGLATHHQYEGGADITWIGSHYHSKPHLCYRPSAGKKRGGDVCRSILRMARAWSL